ncbi:MAG: histidine kinase [Armatimonadetes bacterium]|nr:histidine kinase [Armatimonadota bacterium]
MPVALCLGEALIDFVADVSGVSLLECPGFRKAPGGAPANVAVGLCRLGVPAAFLGKVGEDAFGRFLEQTFATAGADTRFLRFDPDTRTGLAFVSLRADGEREFVFYRNPSADMLYRPEEIPDAAFEDCRVYHFGSITLIQEPSRSATLDALARARAAGALISYDPNLRPPLWPDLSIARQRILEAFPEADFVKVSEEEAEFLLGSGSPEELALQLLERGPTVVAVTRGAQGCVLASRSACVSLPGFPVEAVDTTGAGDGFVAGILFQALARGGLADLSSDLLQEWGLFGNAVGALTCLTKGAIPALPTLSTVQEFLNRHSR